MNIKHNTTQLNNMKEHYFLELTYDYEKSQKIYIGLLKTIDILRAKINLSNLSYSILDFDIKYLNIFLNVNCNDVNFNYEEDKYLCGLVNDGTKCYIVFNNLFINKNLLNLIDHLICNNDDNLNFDKLTLFNKFSELNTNLLKQSQNNENNIYDVEILLYDEEFESLADKLNISTNILHLGIINLIIKIFSDKKEKYVMYYTSNEKINNTDFMYKSFGIYYDTINEMSILEYFKITECNLLTLLNCFDVSKQNIIINDVRNLNINTNDINNLNKCNLLNINILSNNKFIVETNDLTISNITYIFQKVYNYFIKCKNFNINLCDVDFKFINTPNFVETNYKNPVVTFLDYLRFNKKKLAVVADESKINFIDLYNSAVVFGEKYFTNMAPNTIIPIFIKKSIELIVALLSITLHGLGFCVVNYESSKSMFDEIISNFDCEYIISDDNRFDCNKQFIFPNLLFDTESQYDYSDNRYKNIHESNIAYVVFTSGSTGKPKGVIQTYRTLSNVTKWENEYNNYESKSLLFNHSFDASILDIFTCLFFCKTLYIFKNLYDTQNLKFVETALMTSTIFNKIYSKFDISQLRSICLGGEKIHLSENKFLNLKNNGVKIYNLYGPTEVGILSSAKEITTYEEIKKLNIGCPIVGMQNYILDNNLNECPIDVIGQICVSGVQLFNGYVDKTIDTNLINTEKYGIIYKTGDYGLRNSSNEIEYIGRIDRQIKKNGVRIELQYIDNVLLKYFKISDSFTIFENNKIIANIICKKIHTIEHEEIYKFLLEKLGSLYLPDIINIVDSFIFNTNGKFIVNDSIISNDLLNIEKKTQFTETEYNIYSLIQHYYDVTIDDFEKPLYSYGFDSLKIFELSDMLTKIINYNYMGLITINSNLSQICELNNVLRPLIEFIDNDSEKLLIIFRNGERGIIGSSNELNNMNILIVENYYHIESKDPFDKRFDIINKYIDNHKNVFIGADCIGCSQAINFIDKAEKIILYSPTFDELFLKMNENDAIEKINILLNNDSKIYYYFGWYHDYNFSKNTMEKLKPTNIKIKTHKRKHLYFRDDKNLFVKESDKIFFSNSLCSNSL